MVISSLKITPYSFEGNSLVSPTELTADTVLRHLVYDQCHQAKGYVVLPRIREFFAKRGGSVFSEVNGVATDDTRFICNLLQGVIRRLGASVQVFSLSFDGLNDLRSDDSESVSYEQFRGKLLYHRYTRFGVSRFLDILTAMAKRNGENISREKLFEEAEVDSTYRSIKKPHLDTFVGIGALQRHCENVEGGDTVIYDIGKFCNERRLKPWNVLVPMSPDPEKVFGAGDVRFVPYNGLVVRSQYINDLSDNYSSVVTSSDDDIVIFNNMITQYRDGSFHCVAHGATPPLVKSEVEPKRNLCLSFAPTPARLLRSRDKF